MGLYSHQSWDRWVLQYPITAQGHFTTAKDGTVEFTTANDNTKVICKSQSQHRFRRSLQQHSQITGERHISQPQKGFFYINQQHNTANHSTWGFYNSLYNSQSQHKVILHHKITAEVKLQGSFKYPITANMVFTTASHNTGGLYHLITTNRDFTTASYNTGVNFIIANHKTGGFHNSHSQHRCFFLPQLITAQAYHMTGGFYKSLSQQKGDFTTGYQSTVAFSNSLTWGFTAANHSTGGFYNNQSNQRDIFQQPKTVQVVFTTADHSTGI